MGGKRKESPVNQPSIFQEGDRVCAYDKFGKITKGTVTWMGNSTKTRKFEFNVIGICTVSMELEFIYLDMVITFFIAIALLSWYL